MTRRIILAALVAFFTITSINVAAGQFARKWVIGYSCTRRGVAVKMCRRKIESP